MSSAETITVPHLGSSTIGYKLGKAYDASLPTLVMVNSFTTSVEQYRPQFADETSPPPPTCSPSSRTATARPAPRTSSSPTGTRPSPTCRSSTALDIPEAFILGTSQGGWIAARMAILAPGTVKGIIPLGTSMDFESQRSRDLGCWDGIEFCTPAIDALADSVGDDWVIPTELVDAVLKEGLGEDVPPEERTFWHATYQKNYAGDARGASVSGSAPSTCVTATACTAGSTACDARSCGCTAPKTRSTPSPMPRMR
jgi:pimeloyl-ACP methyl ester carboxylesterase